MRKIKIKTNPKKMTKKRKMSLLKRVKSLRNPKEESPRKKTRNLIRKIDHQAQKEPKRCLKLIQNKWTTMKNKNYYLMRKKMIKIRIRKKRKNLSL